MLHKQTNSIMIMIACLNTSFTQAGLKNIPTGKVHHICTFIFSCRFIYNDFTFRSDFVNIGSKFTFSDSSIRDFHHYIQYGNGIAITYLDCRLVPVVGIVIIRVLKVGEGNEGQQSRTSELIPTDVRPHRARLNK